MSATLITIYHSMRPKQAMNPYIAVSIPAFYYIVATCLVSVAHAVVTASSLAYDCKVSMLCTCMHDFL